MSKPENWDRDYGHYTEEGLKCVVNGLSAADADRDGLLAIIGYLDDHFSSYMADCVKKHGKNAWDISGE